VEDTERVKWLLLAVFLLTFLVHSALGEPCFRFYAPETTHTVMLPFERSFVFSVRLSNVGDEELLVTHVGEPHGEHEAPLEGEHYGVRGLWSIEPEARLA